MARRIFGVEITIVATVELDDAVIDDVDDEWRSVFYNLHTPEQVARHIAYNLVCNDARLSMLDGWADQPDSNAALLSEEVVEMDAWEEHSD